MHLASCAQWIRHRPMEPGIAASSPAEVISPSSRLRVVSLCQTTAHNQVIFPSSRLRAVSLHGTTAHSQTTYVLGCYCGTLTTTRNVPFSPSKTPRASLSLPLKCCVIHTKRVSSVPHSETCWGSCAHCIKKLKNECTIWESSPCRIDVLLDHACLKCLRHTALHLVFQSPKFPAINEMSQCVHLPKQ